jgi:hypothetical protein
MIFLSDIIGVVPWDFMEITPIFSVLLPLSVTLIFLWLGFVLWRLFVRAIFTILCLLKVCINELLFVLVPKFLLNFDTISIGISQ